MRHITRDWHYFGEHNKFRCPKCLTAFEYQPDEWYDKIEVCCPECEFEFTVEMHTDAWYEQEKVSFAQQFLRMRGYEGEPMSWYAVACYLENFIKGDQERCASWNDLQWYQAFRIVREHFNKRVQKKWEKDVDPRIIACLFKEAT